MVAVTAPQKLRRCSHDSCGTKLWVRTSRLSDLNAEDFRRWESLAERALDPNPFLAPSFISALCRRVVDPQSIVVLIVEGPDAECWRACGVFRESEITSTSPLVYLEALRTDYSFLDGMLVDREHSDAAIEALFYELSAQRRWHGLRMRMLHRDSPFARRFDATARRLGMVRFKRDEIERAEISLEHPITVDSLLAACSKSRRKKLRRARRVLEELGEVRFELSAPGPDEQECVDEFLGLERLGWKGEVGTALGGNPATEEFFREAVRGFCPTRDAWFGRLLLNGRAVASTCNFRAGSTLYAFKIGWDPRFEDGLPGYWSELELACAAQRYDPNLERIDSCSSSGSYVESIWPGRRIMSFESYVWSRRARVMGVVREQLSGAKRLMTEDG